MIDISGYIPLYPPEPYPDFDSPEAAIAWGENEVLSGCHPASSTDWARMVDVISQKLAKRFYPEQVLGMMATLHKQFQCTLNPSESFDIIETNIKDSFDEMAVYMRLMDDSEMFRCPN